MTYTEQLETLIADMRDTLVNMRERIDSDDVPEGLPHHKALVLFPDPDEREEELLIDGYHVIGACEEYVYTGPEYPGVMDIESFISLNPSGMAYLIDRMRAA